MIKISLISVFPRMKLHHDGKVIAFNKGVATAEFADEKSAQRLIDEIKTSPALRPYVRVAGAEGVARAIAAHSQQQGGVQTGAVDGAGSLPSMATPADPTSQASLFKDAGQAPEGQANEANEANAPAGDTPSVQESAPESSEPAGDSAPLAKPNKPAINFTKASN